MNHVLFLCSGNFYRSRFAEVVFNWHARQRGLGWQAESRGLAISERNSGPVSRHTIAALADRGIPAENCHRLPLPVSEADFAGAHRIVAVKEAEHRPLVEARFSVWRNVIEYWHVDDLDCTAPRDALAHLEREVFALLGSLFAAAA